jgi:hypothetical protein
MHSGYERVVAICTALVKVIISMCFLWSVHLVSYSLTYPLQKYLWYNLLGDAEHLAI